MIAQTEADMPALPYSDNAHILIKNGHKRDKPRISLQMYVRRHYYQEKG